MRVIAGTAKGRTLAPAPGDSTRPITDRVKAALFSILNSADMIEERRYLDLFGRTGAVGIEALSRGAAEVVFCERNRATLRTFLQHNLTATGFSEPRPGCAGRCFCLSGARAGGRVRCDLRCPAPVPGALVAGAACCRCAA